MKINLHLIQLRYKKKLEQAGKELQVLFIGLVLLTLETPGSRDGAIAGKPRTWYPGSCSVKPCTLVNDTTVTTVLLSFDWLRLGSRCYRRAPDDEKEKKNPCQCVADRLFCHLTATHFIFVFRFEQDSAKPKSIFSGSADIKHLLPVESSHFQMISSEFLTVMKKVYEPPFVLDV